MEFAFTEEQTELATTVRSMLAKRADSAAVRAASTSAQGYDPALWSVLCEQIGAAALGIPEAYDGAGFSLFESLIVLEEVGRSLAPSPLLSCLVLTEALLAVTDEDARKRLLPRLAAGEIGALALEGGVSAEGDLLSGTATAVLDGDRADVVMVVASTTEGPALFEVDPAGITRTWAPTVDQSLRLADLVFDRTPATRIRTDAAPVIERALVVGAAGVAALAAGAAAHGLEMTVAYSKVRVQFGRQIGSFQALKHRMADMLVRLEMARSASWAASYALSVDADNAADLAHIAKSYCTDALDHIAGETIQLHGGIAITWEHDAQLVFKRAHALAQLFGQAHQHRALVTL